MIISKQARTFILAAAFAAFGVGCAMDATSEPTSGQSAEDLGKKTSPNNAVTPGTKVDLTQTTNPALSEPIPVFIINAPTLPKTLGQPGVEGDGPRPHPWTPTDPATSEPDGHTNSGSQSPSSDKDKGTPDKPAS